MSLISTAMPLVSVIIPTYNRLSFLKRAIDSIFIQTYPHWELIIVDDGSTDGTWEYLQNLISKKTNNKLFVINQENKGPGPARNLGVKQACGELVAFLDSDDVWLPKKLMVQVEFMQAYPEFQLCQTEEIWIRNKVRVNPQHKHQKPSGWIFEKCLELCLISPSAVMLRRDFFERLGGFDPDFPVCEDYELWLRASLRSPVQTLPEPFVVKHGGHEDQLSRRHWGMDRFRVQALEKILNTQTLTIEQRDVLLRVLKKKLQIFAKGFSKHRPSEPNLYEKRLKELDKRLSNMELSLTRQNSGH